MKQPEDDSKSNGILDDPRFSKLRQDPRYKHLPKVERKVQIGARFKSMFEDDKFRLKYTVDKYGRRVKKTTSEDLRKFYDINSSDEDDEAEKQLEEKEIVKDEPQVIGASVLGKNPFRGEVSPRPEESSSDEESSEDDDDEVFISHVWGELDNDAPKTDESTKRLAACNMDWDRIRASDIMVLCSSFLPPGGSIVKVSIYPSEFGKERLAEEEVNGPPELTSNNDNDNRNDGDGDDDDDELVKEQDSDAEEGEDYHMEKLRQYQLNRLKYYYAVIECDTVATADKVYAECDGVEYESTATKMDLRFIPDDMQFEDEPKDVCTQLPDLNQYQPRLFTTTALQQAKVELTWDETSVERRELNEKLLSGNVNAISAEELKNYVAYSSEDEQENDDKDDRDDEESVQDDKKQDSLAAYKSLLNEINSMEAKKKEQHFDMEYTWSLTTDRDVNDSDDKKDQLKTLTPFEQILEKKRMKKKKRVEEIKKKLKQNNTESSDEMPDDIDMNDPYFAEEFANGEFEKPRRSVKKSNKHNDQTNDSNENVKELELLLDDVTDDAGRQHFSLKKIQDGENETKSKRKRRKHLKKSKSQIQANRTEIEDNFKINLNDDRFKAVYESPLFNIDPTDSHFKKTKGVEAIIERKLKRHSEIVQDPEPMEQKRSKKNVENSVLVKNLIRKIQNVNKNL